MLDGKYVNPAIITGSWFPSGFHGHYRSKCRNDVNSAYRQLAKPQPPRVFLTRMKEAPTENVFSKHDNRFSYITDATYLDQGVGKKRKINTSISSLKSQPGLLSWTPTVQQTAGEHTASCSHAHRPSSAASTATSTGAASKACMGPYHNPGSLDHSLTHYRMTFTGNTAPTPTRQLLLPDEMLATTTVGQEATVGSVTASPLAAPSGSASMTNVTSKPPLPVPVAPQEMDDSDERSVTAYRYAYGQYNPYRQTIQAMHRDALLSRPFSSFAESNRSRNKLCPSLTVLPPDAHYEENVTGHQSRVTTSYEGRESVAGCLTWHLHHPSDCNDACKKPLLHRRPKTCCFGERNASGEMLVERPEHPMLKITDMVQHPSASAAAE